MTPIIATYRVQLTPTFDLFDAAQLVPQLRRLGISHLYTSSYLQAASGSTHGYDVVDPALVNVELGGEEGLAALRAALSDAEMGNVIDVVPNHMATATPDSGARNEAWWDVLRHGQASAHASMFDIDWSPPQPDLAGRVLLAILDAAPDAVIARGDIRPRLVAGEWVLGVPGVTLPLDPASISGDGRARVEAAAAGDRAALTTLLDAQHYRLDHWRRRDELNHRRFFEVDSLIGVRVEQPDVFDAVHQRTLGWIVDGVVDGLRVDHPDGLRDPAAYLHRLRAGAPTAWITVEKILALDERLPSDWPVDGTTGYEALNLINGLFVDAAAAEALLAAAATFTGDATPPAERLAASKRQAAHELFPPELARVVRLAAGALGATTEERRQLPQVIEDLLVAMPVYRTYVTPGAATAVDVAIIERIVDDVVRAAPERADLAVRLGAALRDPDATGDGVELIARFQQLSGPVMAKGVEDTAFYRIEHLLALNEVGGDPRIIGVSADDFHRRMITRATEHPLAMTATSTHDTKRSEDVRIRIALLSQRIDGWTAASRRWQALNRDHWRGRDPDASVEYMIYQLLVGAHPLPAERLRAVVRKSIREAKLHTSWTAPDDDYETAIDDFIVGILTDRPFTDDLAAFVAGFDIAARAASLSQLLLKCTIPGVPDFYQGSELWTDGLVDPDNRRPVDHERISALLDAIDAGGVPSIDLADDHIGVTKLAVTQRLLHERAEHLDAFTGADAGYGPLPLRGDRADGAIAFCRSSRIVVIAPIRTFDIVERGWGETVVDLPDGSWRDPFRHDAVFRGATPVQDIVNVGHGAFLVAESAPESGGRP